MNIIFFINKSKKLREQRSQLLKLMRIKIVFSNVEIAPTILILRFLLKYWNIILALVIITPLKILTVARYVGRNILVVIKWNYGNYGILTKNEKISESLKIVLAFGMDFNECVG